MDNSRILTIIPAPVGLMASFKGGEVDFSVPVLCQALVEVEERGETLQYVLPMIAHELEGIALTTPDEYDDLTLNGKSCTHV
ncbi:hypothetical protein [uncultured Desulfuromonas sp.]|uniref:hypothetical protein n=1 Tax=uncultured Desulfuromonas sp. TaxID=181013 RepID=UPI002AABF0AC|nr:hypothetical protein [uncultured Desulfuromonas sp.]